MNLDVETAQKIVDFLNELLELDRPAVEGLVDARVICNEGMCDHPTVQVHMKDDEFQVGLLGLLNGLCGTKEDGWGLITAQYEGDADPELVKFYIDESIRG